MPLRLSNVQGSSLLYQRTLVDRLSPYLAAPRCLWHTLRVRRETRGALEETLIGVPQQAAQSLAFFYWDLRR